MNANMHDGRPARLAALAFGLALTLAGCGGPSASRPGGGSDFGLTPGPTAGTGEVLFQIQWPGPGRVIPPTTNRVVVYATGDGIRSLVAAIADRPTSGGSTTTVPLRVPAGTGRLFYAEARNVPNPTGGVIASPTVAQLLEGTVLAAGPSDKPLEVVLGQPQTVSITLGAPATPPAGTQRLDVSLQQVILDSFPLVKVLALCRTQDGTALTNLHTGNFGLAEDATNTPVADVRPVGSTGAGLSVVLVLDRSGSMMGQPFLDLQAAAKSFVQQLGPDDQCEIVSFESGYAVDQPFTKDKAQLQNVIDNLYTGNMTALWDASLLAVQDASKVDGRKAVIVMTDGVDNWSYASVSEVIDAAKAAGVPCYTIGLGSALTGPLQLLASETNGLFFLAPQSSQLKQIYDAIGKSLSAQIQILFVSPSVSQFKSRQVTLSYSCGNFTGTSNTSYLH